MIRPLVARGARVWDIGANVGVFAFAAAHVAGPAGEVVAVEPDLFLAALLQRSALLAGNRDLAVSVVCAAVSETPGLALLCVASRGRSSNALAQVGHRSQAGGTRYVQHSATLTLDGLLAHFQPPQIVKIDVEGAEAMVLAGATRLLAECRPCFYVEVGTRQCAQVREHFKRHDYRLFDGDSRDGREIDDCCWNTLAVPRESDLTNRGI